MWFGLLRLARPKDWIKGVFILLPVPFAMAAGAGQLSWPTLAIGILGFSLMSSAVYCYNDAQDAEADRLHPTKCRRPVASGLVSRRAAFIAAAVLCAASLGLLLLAGKPGALLLTAAYGAANLVYSHYAKHIPPLDIFLLASFFMIRVFLGCVLVETTPSNWLLLCSSTLALFLVLAKRRADLVAGLGSEHRQSLSGYSVPFLDQAMGMTAGIAVLSYALYSLEAAIFIPGREFASLPFAAAGILDYLRLAQVHGIGGSPVDTALSEPSVLICGLGWATAVMWSLNL